MEDRVGMGPQGSFTPHLRPGSKAREVSTWTICARKVRRSGPDGAYGQMGTCVSDRTQDVIGTVDRTVC